MRRSVTLLAVLALAVSTLVTLTSSAGAATTIKVKGLNHPARLTQDVWGVTHIDAANEHDVFFLQGWVQARDRLFQMDVTRRTASGTLAELLGKGALSDDVQLRTIGLRRAAQRTWQAASREGRAVLTAFSDGVNAYVRSHATLPPEYAALHTGFASWTPLDSVAVGKVLAFGLSFELDVDRTVQLQSYVAAFGPTTGPALFADLERIEPFSHASTVPDATGSVTTVYRPLTTSQQHAVTAAADLGRAYLAKVRNVPLMQQARVRDYGTGSNEWAVSGRLTRTGRAILANDPHLSFSSPSTLYPIGLRAGRMDVEGEGFAGAPGVILGHNAYIEWGETVNPMDVTDTYLEQIQPDPTSPSGLSTIYKGAKEHVIPIPETFRYNAMSGSLATATAADGVPAATLIVPRRNQGPIIQLDTAKGTALSVQYTGFSPTQELQAFLIIDRARNLREFEAGLEYFDVGSQNFAYADRWGNIGYFTSAEMPVREDLQAGKVSGNPPWLIRNGTGGNEWLPVIHRQPHQAVPYEILPYIEMPHVVNPKRGWFINANNDPAGTNLDNDPLNQMRPHGGIYYLNAGYDGFRAGRITEMLKQRLSHGRVSIADIQAMQADTGLLDAEYFVPWIKTAYADASAPGADPTLSKVAADSRVKEAVQRLSAWNFTTPTGIPQGYDASDLNGALRAPTPGEQANSVAATIYAVWRSSFIKRAIDERIAALPKPGEQETLSSLKHLLDTFASSHGVGSSGMDFFAYPGITDHTASRDAVLLASVADALTALSGPAYDAAFHGSTDQSTYRWGLLHRVTLTHPLGAPFSIPPAFGAFPPPLAGVSGIPVDGGFETVDAASHNARGSGSDAFTFDSGPARRYVGSLTPGGSTTFSALPGGTSALPTSKFYLNLLRPYLTNDYYPALLGVQAQHVARSSTVVVKP